MCCRCCTSLKVAATWASAIHFVLGSLLLILYFTVNEDLGDFEIPYLVYLSLVTPEGLFILIAVQKEWGVFLRALVWMFVGTQLFGFGVRLLVPAQVHSFTIIQRIAVLFISILATAVYSATLLLYSRKLPHLSQDGPSNRQSTIEDQNSTQL